MKHFKIYFLLAIFFTAAIISCDKDEFTEADALDGEKGLIELTDSLETQYLLIRDSLNQIGGIVDYTINVYSAGGAGVITSKSDDVSGLVVSVSQNGKVHHDTLDASGMAVFPDMRVSTVTVAITGPNFTEVNFVSDITPRDLDSLVITDDNGTYYNVYRYVATMVPVFPLTGSTVATVNGRLSYESDLTNNAPEPISGATVSATIDVNAAAFTKRFLRWDPAGAAPHGNTAYAGNIIEIAYGDIVSKSLTDATGNYTLEIPSTADGLDYFLNVGDVVADQTIFMKEMYGRNLDAADASQQVRATYRFGETASTVPQVYSAFVEFSDPGGDIDFQPTTEATAVANMMESGLKAVHISNPGYGYTQIPTLTITPGANVLLPTTEATTDVVMDNFGRITAVNVTDEGTGYLVGKDYNAAFKTSTVTSVAKAIITKSLTGTYDVDTQEDTITVVTGGSGYEVATPPTVTIDAPLDGGVAATATANLTGKIDSKINLITNGGDDYVLPADVRVKLENIITGNELTEANFDITLNDIGSLYSVTVTPGTVFDSLNTAIVYADGNGTGVQLSAVMESELILTSVTLTTTGATYNPAGIAPEVQIISGGGSGLDITVSILGSGELAIAGFGAGTGYTSAPTVLIVDDPSNVNAGTAATITFDAIDDIDYSLESITVVNGGANIDFTKTLSGLLFGQDRTAMAGFYSQQIGRPIQEIKVKTDAPTIALNVNFDVLSNISMDVWDNANRGTGATAAPVLTYSVKSITITEKGSGYYTDNRIPKVTIAPPADLVTYTQAKLVLLPANFGDGIVQSIKVDNVGEGYVGSPHILVTDGGAIAGNDRHAEITATATAGALAFTIVDAGEGYEAAEYTISIKTFLTAATVVTEAYEESGMIESITVTNPGSDYTVVPSIVIWAVNAAGDSIEIGDDATMAYGTGATATAVLDDGRVSSITVDNAGSGYYFAPEIGIIIPNSKTRAEGYAIVDKNTGAVKSVTLTNKGAGYLAAPTVTFTALDGGTGATAVAFLNDDETVNKVQMTNHGSDYLGRNYSVYAAVDYFFEGAADLANATGVDPQVWSGQANTNGPTANTSFTIYSGSVVVTDVYMGTGKRVE